MSESAALERAAALAALSLGVDAPPPPAPGLELTGRTVPAGGDLERVLVKRASSLGYVVDGVYHRAGAVPGDVILIDQAQADRLDGLGVTLTREAFDAPDPEPSGVEDEGSDAHLDSLGAPDLIAYVIQHPEAAGRVRELELARPENKQRSTVLAATDPEKLADPGA